ncbi:MAG: spore cortex biosynthesis protein YabQ [Eubacterium sp.]|nr:spore cortex biosynthesis protein YabQ [Eubacterium sp.]
MEAIAISNGILEQGRLFLSGIVCGVVVWFLYDLIRLWRRILPHGTVWMALEDVIFFLVCALVGFQVLYPQSLGQLRVFLILAFGVGSLAYHKLVSPYLIRAGSGVIHSIKKRFGNTIQSRIKNQNEKRKKPKETKKNPLKNR